jgi:hypothetical protein
MVKRFSILLAAALLAFAEKDEPRKLRAWFADGTGIEFSRIRTAIYSTHISSRPGLARRLPR